jgi:hypothetical protein
LLQYLDGDDKEVGKSPSSEGTFEEAGIPDSPTTNSQRATSINLGKGHVRNFSAGSAKLLEISPRASGETRRSLLAERGTQ